MGDFKAELEQIIAGAYRIEPIEPRTGALTDVASAMNAYLANKAAETEKAYRPLIADVIRNDVGIAAGLLERIGANPPVMLISSIKHEHHERPRYDKKLSPLRYLFNRFEKRVYPTITKIEERYWRLGKAVVLMHSNRDESVPLYMSGRELFASEHGDIVVSDFGTRVAVFDDGEAIPRREFGPVRPATDLDIVPPGSVNVFQSFADIIISPEKQSIVQDYRSRMKFLLETSLQEQD